MGEAAKSVKIDISDEDWQEVVDWLLCRRQETSGKNQYMSAVEYFLKRWEPKSPCKAERNTRYHPKASGNHLQAFGNTRHCGLQWASSPGKISINIRKVPHRATTPSLPDSAVFMTTKTRHCESHKTRHSGHVQSIRRKGNNDTPNPCIMWLHYIWYRIKLGPKFIWSLRLL